MSNIYKAFENKKAFIAFLTGGDGGVDKTYEYIMEMVKAGADLVEIGIPFSDPIAEGPVIQAANIRALSVGTTVEKLFDLTKKVSEKTDIPLVFLTYINPVFKYGYEAFCKKCSQCGVSGLIIPDLPYEEKGEINDIAKAYGVDIISLVAPTSEDRIKTIASKATGFVYTVSSMGVTGMRSEIKTDVKSIVETIKASTSTPAAVGFGINTPRQAKKIASYADGVIVGSAIVKIIEKHGDDAGKYIYDYVKEMKRAVKEAE